MNNEDVSLVQNAVRNAEFLGRRAGRESAQRVIAGVLLLVAAAALATHAVAMIDGRDEQ